MAMDARSAEAAQKLASLRDVLQQRQAGAIVLTRIPNFAWLTAGARSFINVAAEDGAAWAVVTPSRAAIVTSNIEAARLREEELPDLDWELVACPWWDGAAMPAAVRDLVGTAAVLSDGSLPGSESAAAEVAALRVRLTEGEQTRARSVARDAADALEATCRAIRRGEGEWQIAARLAEQAYTRGLEPVVHLVAADERVFTRRHPLPTARAVERYAMVVLCGMRDGLVLSCTRLVHLGAVPDDLARRWLGAAQVDAEMIAATRPGATAGQIFSRARQAYAAAGFPDEWQHHHQGGLAGYASREWRAVPDGTQVVAAGQIFAWNPSVAGAKSEDTVLSRADGIPEVLTEMPSWPASPLRSSDGHTVRRPQILVL